MICRWKYIAIMYSSPILFVPIDSFTQCSRCVIILCCK